MSIKFETFGMPNSICKQEISQEENGKIAKRVAKANASLLKKMKKIAIKEAKVWRKSYHIRG